MPVCDVLGYYLRGSLTGEVLAWCGIYHEKVIAWSFDMENSLAFHIVQYYICL
jgi:hypothetical protein